MVTFGRMATGELRERVRRAAQRDRAGARTSARRRCHRPRRPGDRAADHGRQGRARDEAEPPAAGAGRLRLGDDRDDARLLPGRPAVDRDGGGPRSRHRRSPTTSRDLTEEVLDDLYVRRFHGRDTPPFSRARRARGRSDRGLEPARADRAAQRSEGQRGRDADAPRPRRSPGDREAEAPRSRDVLSTTFSPTSAAPSSSRRASTSRPDSVRAIGSSSSTSSRTRTRCNGRSSGARSPAR